MLSVVFKFILLSSLRIDWEQSLMLSVRLRDTPQFLPLHKTIISLVVRGSEEIRTTARALARELIFSSLNG